MNARTDVATSLDTHGKGHAAFAAWPLFNAGDDLLSHTLSRAVQSALRGLTSVFGMGTGGSPAVRSPTFCGGSHLRSFPKLCFRSSQRGLAPRGETSTPMSFYVSKILRHET